MMDGTILQDRQAMGHRRRSCRASLGGMKTGIIFIRSAEADFQRNNGNVAKFLLCHRNIGAHAVRSRVVAGIVNYLRFSAGDFCDQAGKLADACFHTTADIDDLAVDGWRRSCRNHGADDVVNVHIIPGLGSVSMDDNGTVS